ncbi:MAG: hypothetical protein H7Y31_09970 [Chitinophagaceae bacterium]|nr:hypothetical protein [Chitinophagaceae bacterium]
MNKIFWCIILFFLFACNNRSEQQSDEIYSRHLQRKVKLAIIHSSKETESMDLLLLNDGQDMPELGLREIVDSLSDAGSIHPLLIVGIEAGDRQQEYGISGIPDYANRGSRADKYNAFVNNELYPFIKKKTGVKKFHSVSIAGWSLGGLSAFDIGWNYSDRFDKVGVFSGSFWWRDVDSGDSTYSNDKNRIAYARAKSTRKKKFPQIWFYAGQLEEQSDRDHDSVVDVIDDTQDVRNILISRGLTTEAKSPIVIDPGGRHDLATWKKHFPTFLVWISGK